MEAVELPTENAHEPVEEARQPPCDVTMSSQEPSKPKNRHATFADDVTTTQKELSQSSSAYKEALSQPGPGLSHRHRLAWLQRRRGPGLWVQCDSCESWRHLPHVVDAHQLPPKWYCSMNPEKSMANCSVPEAPLRVTDEEDLIHSEYSAGSLVWARLPGWPWWPAMVDDCPDTEQFYWLDGFSDIPTYYNVVFFDATDVTRAWIAPENLKPFTLNKSKQRHALKDKKYKKRLETAMKQAEKAEKLPVLERLAEFSFISTYKGAIVSPRKVTKRELERFQIQLQKKFNVDFPIEVSSETDDEVQTFRENNKRKNVIIIGTPKTKKTKRARITNDDEDNAAIKTGDNDNEKHNKNNDEKTKNNKQKIETIIATPNTPMRKKEMKGACNKKPKNIVNDILTEIPGNPDSEITISEKTVTAPNTVNENETVEPSTNGVSLNTFKHPDPDSMAIEVGSTQTLNWIGIDNDSSKTYLPEDKTDSVVDTQDFQIRINSPSSDDFDF